MREICIVPAYRRPEFLYLCLKRIAACHGIENILVRVSLDQHARSAPVTPEETAVLAFWRKRLPLDVVTRAPHSYSGNSFNVLMAYKQAALEGFDRIYMVEEDVMLASDFFIWQREALDSGDWFCAIASIFPDESGPHWARYVNDKVYTAPRFSGIGLGWKRDKLELIFPHATPEYFSNQSHYCARKFPRHADRQFTEQDGLIGRIMEEAQVEGAWAAEPKAFHIGFYGYHRGLRNPVEGKWEERANEIEALWGDREKIRALSTYFKHDIEAVPGNLI